MRVVGSSTRRLACLIRSRTVRQKVSLTQISGQGEELEVRRICVSDSKSSQGVEREPSLENTSSSSLDMEVLLNATSAGMFVHDQMHRSQTKTKLDAFDTKLSASTAQLLPQAAFYFGKTKTGS